MIQESERSGALRIRCCRSEQLHRSGRSDRGAAPPAARLSTNSAAATAAAASSSPRCGGRPARLKRRRRPHFDEHPNHVGARGGGYHVMQLHPADAGGSFLEWIRTRRASPKAIGSRRRRRSAQAERAETVSGFSAVELRSPDPAGLADDGANRGCAAAQGARGRLEPLDDPSVASSRRPTAR